MINKTYCGDNLEIMKELPSESIDLIYADPPFFTQRNWDDFDDTFNDMNDYLDFIRPRLVECRRVLSNTGSIYCHLDWHAVHYVKVMMDEIFGYKNFRNEIIWHYASGGAPKDRLAKKHDNILVYSKGKHPTFNIQRIPYRTIIGRTEEHKYHPDGKMMDDVWDIGILSTAANERTGYKTQKPGKLLERIIEISTNPGDLILDPFCGSGTTVAVAQKLGRRWIGIDDNPDAIKLTESRLNKNLNKWS